MSLAGPVLVEVGQIELYPSTVPVDEVGSKR
jgi:hypothetical protein